MTQRDKDVLATGTVVLMLLEAAIAFLMGMNYEQHRMHVEPCKLDSKFTTEMPATPLPVERVQGVWQNDGVATVRKHRHDKPNNDIWWSDNAEHWPASDKVVVTGDNNSVVIDGVPQ